MQFEIISDSACDLPQEWLECNKVGIVSFYVSFDGEEYLRERIDIGVPDFYEKMAGTKSFPKTSMPSVQDYLDVFLPLAKEGRPVLCICLNSRFSGSMQSAVTAKMQIEEKYPQSRIEVMDSTLATVLQGLLVREAVRMRDENMELEEACRALAEIIPTGRIFFTTNDLEYLQHGGRIGKAAALAGSLLKVKPMILYQEGELQSAGVSRGRKKSLRKVLDLVLEYIQNHEILPEEYQIAVGYGLDQEEYQLFYKEVEKVLTEYAGKELEIIGSHIGATIGVHTGPCPIGVGLLKKYRR